MNFPKGYLKKNKIIPKSLLIIFATIMALLVLETVLGLTEHKIYDYTPCTSLDKNFHHIMIPGKKCRYKTDEWDVIYNINNFGFRGKDTTIEKPTGTFRILLLGDSFTQGHGISENQMFSTLLENNLNQSNLGEKFEIINSGVFAYSPMTEYLYLIKRGLDFKPDLVLVVFTITDFWDERQRYNEMKSIYPNLTEEELNTKIQKGEVEFNFEKINIAAAQNKDQQPSTAKRIFLVKQWLRKNIRIYKNLTDFVKKRNQINVQQDVLYKGDIDKDFMAIARGSELTEKSWQKLWDFPMFSIEQMNSILKKNAIPFIVVAIPDAIQVSGRESPNRKGFGFDENYSDPRGGYQTELAKRLSKMDVPFIDLLTDFRKSNSFPLYFTHDMHWTALGHELGAEMIVKELKEYLEF